MSLREDEDRQKNCPSRGLGLGVAVAAIGVGVGAALYYFMNRRPENPNTAGSTSQNWTCEPEHNLQETEDTQETDNSVSRWSDADSSFTTISEHSTTDTSINSSIHVNCHCGSDMPLSDSDLSVTDSSDSRSESDANEWNSESSESSESSDPELNEWDVTHSTEFPNYVPPSILTESSWNFLLNKSFQRNNNWYQTCAENYRKRTWTLEECSICFEVILQDQEVMSLPCTHNFHTKCILPWLQEQQTCPNCRKPVD